ncbi:MAG: flagellar basal body P-ring formation protein FlgA [Planctomycetes bacterium]|nr:flagellar basal body P-ring formation protein FlgA [Planctomycetota bacterium]
MSAILALVLLAAGGDAPAPDAPPVELRAASRTPGTRIRLEDLVLPEHAGRLSGDLLAIDLGRSPSPGVGRLLTLRAVQAALPEGAALLAGPAEITVHTDVVRVDPADILAAAREFLLAAVPLPQGAQVEVAREPFEVTVPRGRAGLELRPRLRGTPAGRGHVNVLTEVRVDGQLQAVVPATFLVRTFADVEVLAGDLGRGQALAAGNVATVRTETTDMISAPRAGAAAALLGCVARRDLRAGAPLRAGDFQPAILVRCSEPVTLLFSSGALRAEAFGVARDSGALGDPVRVENLTTRKTVVGRVAGPGLVQMHP